MKKIHRSIWALVLTFTMLLGTCTSAFAATSRAEEPEMKEPGIVTIRSGDNVNGKIQGVPSDTEGVTVYKGVPFAEPPVGELRWKAPQDLTETWDDVRVCDKWGNQAMQPENLNPVGEFWGDEFYFDEDYNPEISEDCLYLNVYAPEHAEDEQLPVMVWIHGGGYDHGHASEMEFNASKLAAQGIIVVCIQYRVNVFGFLALPELSAENEEGVSGNYGTLDQIKALEWVNENIAGFGGDPENVTICGQSAGAMSVTALLSTDMTDGLFNRAIIQSGFGGYAAPGSYKSLEEKEETCQNAIEKAFGEGVTLEELRAKDAKDFLADDVYSSLKSAAGNNTLDNYVFTEESIDLTLEGALDGIDIMIGGTADEYTSLSGTPDGTMDVEAFQEKMENQYGELYNRSIYNALNEKQAYRMNLRSTSDSSLAKYRISAEYGKTHNEDHNAYVYYFDHDLAPHDPEIVGNRDEDFYGSFHSSELWYMFNSMRDDIEGQRNWTDADHELGDMMSTYWANFVKTGDPNGEGLPVWEECTSDTNGAFMHFKDVEDGVAAVCTTKSDYPARDRLMMAANLDSFGLTEDDLQMSYNIPYGDIPTEIVTEVLDDGQRVVEINLTYDSAVDEDSVSKDDYKIKATLTYGDGSNDLEGYRTITDIDVNGNVVTIELDPEDETAVTSFYSSLTTPYDISYLVTQKGEIETAEGTVEPAKYKDTSITNRIVDDFQSATGGNVNGRSLNYRYYDPIKVNGVSEDGKYPLILFLHGGGEKGDNNLSHLIANKGAVAWVEPDRVARNPVYVLAPQCPTEPSGWINKENQDLVVQILEEFIQEHPQVDTDRIYIEGMSMGGMGTWEMILEHPDLFAAAIPICGRVSTSYYEDGGKKFDALANMPIWVAHAEDDPSVNVQGSDDAVAALQAHGNTSVKYYKYLPESIWPNHHHSWKAVYEDEEIYNWLFEQNKSRTKNGTINPKTLYTVKDYGDGVQAIWDYDVDPMYVMVNGDRAVLIDTGMGQGDLYGTLKAMLPDTVKTIDVLLTHSHGDHTGQAYDFAEREDVEHIYIGSADEATVKAMLERAGKDTSKLTPVNDGDQIPFGDQSFQVIDIYGHTPGSVGYMIEDKLFTGDAIGSGYVWMQIGVCSIEEYVNSLQHLNDAIGDRDLTVYGGHTQYRGTMTDQYVRDILECAKGIVDGSIEGEQYIRGNVRDAKIATYGTASIVYDPAKVTDTCEVELVTKVMDDGQKVIEAVVTYPEDVNPDSISTATYQVRAEQTADNPTFNNVGMRTITGVQVDGNQVTISLDPTDTIAGTSYFDYNAFQTFMFDLSYEVTQLRDVELANGETVAAGGTYANTSITNLTVDDFQEAEVTNKAGKTIPYRYYDPIQSAGKDADGKYPVVIFLHGAGESGDNNLSHIIANKGAVVWADRVDMNPCYVLAPQCPSMAEGWVQEDNEALVMQMLDEFIAEHADTIDTDRIYIQGLSMGGYGTWKIILDHPEIFAAAMPMCGGVDDSYYANNNEAFQKIKNMAIWTFHNADDSTVPVENTRKVVEALKAVGSQCIKYEEYSAGSTTPDPHQVWKYVYSDRNGTPYNWLFQQSLSRSKNHTQNPSLEYTKETIKPGMTVVRDYELGQIWVLENKDGATVIDTGMGAGDLFDYIVNNVLENKNANMNVVLTHNHGDHIGCLDDFVGKDQVKNVYVAEGDKDAIIKKMGPDADKVSIVKDGDFISIGNGENLEVVAIPGHTAGSIVLFYGDEDVFTGDAVGSGDLWMQIGMCSIQTYTKSLQHFIDKVNGRQMMLRTGHAENLEPFTEEYLDDLMNCAEGIIDGSIEPTVYPRRDASYASYGRANIVYYPYQIFDADFTDLNEAIQDAESRSSSKYTSDSWAKLQEAVAAAKALPSTATQPTVDAAVQAINDAIKALVPRSSSSSSGGGSTTVYVPADSTYGEDGSGVPTTPGTGTGTTVTGPYVKSDTTLPFTVKQGQAYCFKMTLVNGSNILPLFTVGDGSVFKTQFVTQIGNDYYFRIWAIGDVGESTGVYTTLTGQAAQQHCVVTIAA